MSLKNVASYMQMLMISIHIAISERAIMASSQRTTCTSTCLVKWQSAFELYAASRIHIICIYVQYMYDMHIYMYAF